MSEIYIGTLSGTSADAIDTGIFSFEQNKTPVLIAHHSEPLPTIFKMAITTFQAGTLSAYELMQLDINLGKLIAQSVNTLIGAEKIAADTITAIGSHGQTMIHKPNENPAFSVQIGNPYAIASKTNIVTVADFRSADIALGGQGAPLTSAFHQTYFAEAEKSKIIINIGGICNVTFLDGTNEINAFDCGPGNTLLDYWAQRHLEQPYDDGGQWASSKSYDPNLLSLLQNNNFLKQKPLKSACTSDFSSAWLHQQLKLLDPDLEPATIQATLTESVAVCIGNAVKEFGKPLSEVFIYGGGVHNRFLLERIQQRVDCPIQTTESLGLNPQWVEAATFAWLAKQRIHNKPANIPAVTGASKPSTLGLVYDPGIN